MTDILAHYQMFDFRARCAVAVTTETVRQAQKRHGLDPLTTIAVGRAISCAALLGSTLKAGNREYVHCSFAGDGLLRRVIGECNGDGHCRGYATPPRLLEVLAPGEVLPTTVGEATGGTGVLTVTRGMPTDGAPYNAVSAFENGEIATDVARYLTDSEQIPSAVAAGVKLSKTGEVLAAGGALVQRLGGAELPEQSLVLLEQRMTMLGISDRIAAQGAGNESAKLAADAIVAYLQGDSHGFGLLTTRRLVFQCNCSRAKMSAAMVVLGETELKAILAEVGKLEARCQYCGDTQQFQLAELLVH